MENPHTRSHHETPPSALIRAFRTTKVVVAKRVARIEVPDQPHFDRESTEFFNEAIRQATNYLEYGSGGSTLLAHQHVKNLVSVESDHRFLRAVQRKLSQQGPGAETTLLPVNIGITEHWGKPVFTKPTARRLQRWRKYAQAPWPFFRRNHLEPDLILIDGRFRAACALESLLALSYGSRCRILMDDYVTRHEYRAVEEVADLVEMKGRMAVFHSRPHLDRARCQQLLERAYTDFR
jgi:hypothetical protein